jgi:hypothetical protein
MLRAQKRRALGPAARCGPESDCPLEARRWYLSGKAPPQADPVPSRSDARSITKRYFTSLLSIRS